MATKVVVEEEDASELKLGYEFHNARCLMISEVAVVMDAYLTRRKEEAPDEQPNTVFEKCLEVRFQLFFYRCPSDSTNSRK
jgi:DNA-directed RNA polymerase II subunit RPB4